MSMGPKGLDQDRRQAADRGGYVIDFAEAAQTATQRTGRA